MSIFIFRRDFRIKDNTAWNQMLNETNNSIYPIFIFTPEQINAVNKYKSDNAVQFMIESLLELNKEESKKIFDRTGEITWVEVYLNATILR